MLEQTFSDCCYSRLYQSRPTLPSNSGLIGSSAFSSVSPTSLVQSNDYPLPGVLATDQDEKAGTLLSLAQLTTQLAQLTGNRENSALDNLISSGLPNNANGLSDSSSNADTSKVLSSILPGAEPGLVRQLALQHLNHMLAGSSQPISRPALPLHSIDRSDRPIDGLERSPVERTNEIVQQLQLNVDIEKLYLSKARLLLALRRNETMVTNLSDEERSLLLKAMDTSRLDYAIKRLTGLLQANGTLTGGTAIAGFYAFDVQPPNSFHTTQSSSSHSASNLQPASSLASLQASNRPANLQASSNQQQSNGTQNDLADEFGNRPLVAPSTGSLIDQLQSLLAANKWVANGSVDRYANLPTDEETGLLDDDLDTVNPIADDL